MLAAPIAVPLVAVTFGISVASTTMHLGFEVGSILGPFISAGVAIVIGLGYRAMAQETRERQALILDLVTTREELATASREAGTLADWRVWLLEPATGFLGALAWHGAPRHIRAFVAASALTSRFA